MKKYLIAGLGNIGEEYEHTRHNIGFEIADALAGASAIFSTERYARVASLRLKNKEALIIKPTTYMNLSGKAINYWLQQEKIPLENLLVIVDEIALPLGSIRIKTRGSDGGHNGLRHIQQTLGRQDYARLRFGIGNDFPRGAQVPYVLSPWSEPEWKQLQDRITLAAEAAASFVLAGPAPTMNLYNSR